jgi:hypothetical protein
VRLDNHVANIDTYTESNTAIFGLSNFLDAGLELQGRPNRFDSARKLRQEPVSGVLDYTAAVFGDCWVDGLSQERRQFDVRYLFVIVHEPRIANHIGGQYRRQLALDPDWPFLHHGPQTCLRDTL